MTKLRILVSTSNYPTSHWEAIFRISKIIGKDPKYVERMVNAFFGMYGLRSFINQVRTVSIRNFGRFYFHKNTINAYNRKMTDRKEYYHALRRATSRIAKRKKYKSKK